MGIFSQATNRKKTDREKHSLKWKREKKAMRKAARGPAHVDIQDAELYSVDQLKNKLKHPRNNIDISNKKRQRILKRLKHQQLAEKDQDDTDDEEEEEDVDMAGTEEASKNPEEPPATATTTDSKTPQPGPSSSSASVGDSAKKRKNRKRGGRKARNKKAQAAGVAMEDVEMK